MSETIANPEQNPQLNAEQFNELHARLTAPNFVPASVAEIHNLVTVGEQITGGQNGMELPSGETVEPGKVYEIAEKLDVPSWRLDEQAKQRLASTITATRFKKLTSEQQADVKAFSQASDPSDDHALFRYKDYAQARLDLDRDITQQLDRNSANESRNRREKAATYAQARQDLLDKKLHAELSRVGDAANTVKSAELLASVDARVAEVLQGHPNLNENAKAMLASNLRAKLVEQAGRDAEAAGKLAATERSNLIEKTGGAATIDKINRAEERVRFLKRLHGNDYDRLYDANGSKRVEPNVVDTPDAEPIIEPDSDNGIAQPAQPGRIKRAWAKASKRLRRRKETGEAIKPADIVAEPVGSIAVATTVEQPKLSTKEQRNARLDKLSETLRQGRGAKATASEAVPAQVAANVVALNARRNRQTRTQNQNDLIAEMLMRDRREKAEASRAA